VIPKNEDEEEEEESEESEEEEQPPEQEQEEEKKAPVKILSKKEQKRLENEEFERTMNEMAAGANSEPAAAQEESKVTNAGSETQAEVDEKKRLAN